MFPGFFSDKAVSPVHFRWKLEITCQAVDIRDVPESVTEFQLAAPAQLWLGGRIPGSLQREGRRIKVNSHMNKL